MGRISLNQVASQQERWRYAKVQDHSSRLLSHYWTHLDNDHITGFAPGTPSSLPILQPQSQVCCVFFQPSLSPRDGLELKTLVESSHFSKFHKGWGLINLAFPSLQQSLLTYEQFSVAAAQKCSNTTKIQFWIFRGGSYMNLNHMIVDIFLGL